MRRQYDDPNLNGVGPERVEVVKAMLADGSLSRYCDDLITGRRRPPPPTPEQLARYRDEIPMLASMADEVDPDEHVWILRSSDVDDMISP